MALLSLSLQNRASDFDGFAQMLEIVALNDLASVLCARKFLFALQGGFSPENAPFYLKWLKNGPLSFYFQNCASDFDEFCTDVRDSCPE